jgi:excisionase family DNA binding protein
VSNLIKIEKLAELLDIEVSEIRKMMMRGQIPYVKLSNRRVRFNVSEIEKFIKERTVTAKAVGQ